MGMGQMTLSQVRVGQRFNFVPEEWYGECKLLTKRKYMKYDWVSSKMAGKVIYDITFDANVVNPPGVIYGISGSTKVILL
jgi:hypothetical protein